MDEKVIFVLYLVAPEPVYFVGPHGATSETFKTLCDTLIEPATALASQRLSTQQLHFSDVGDSLADLLASHGFRKLEPRVKLAYQLHIDTTVLEPIVSMIDEHNRHIK